MSFITTRPRFIRVPHKFLVERTAAGSPPAPLVAIDVGGNVGIGTATPAAALDVNGQVRITGGSPAPGRVLTCDGAGMATWQDPSSTGVPGPPGPPGPPGGLAPGVTQMHFDGWLNNGQTLPHTLFQMPGWRSAQLDVVALVHDVNSNTNRLFFHAEYGVYRAWDTAPELVPLTQINNEVGGIYTVSVTASAATNEIVATVAQSGFDTVTRYRIVARYMFAD